MMLRKLVSVLVATGLLLCAASTASAALLMPLQSELKYRLGFMPELHVSGTYRAGGWATLNATQDNLAVEASIWATVAGGHGGTSIYTGTALITNLVITGVNASGTLTGSFTATNPLGGNLTGTTATPSSNTICPGGCLGGSLGFNGQTVISILGTPVPFNMNMFGIGGTGTEPILGLVVTGAPMITGKMRITNVTTNVISIPDRPATGPGYELAPHATEEVKTFTTGGYFVSTYPTAPVMVTASVSAWGSMNVTAGGSGTVTTVTPARVVTGALGVGNLPTLLSYQFVFVPEPGTMLLLVSGTAGLLLLGRKRMRK